MTGLRTRILQLHADGVADVEIAARMMVRLQIVRKLLPREAQEGRGCTEDTESHGEHREAVCEARSVPPSVGSVTDLPLSVSKPIRYVFMAAAAKPRDADAEAVERWIAEHGGVTKVPREASGDPLTRTREERRALGWKILHHKKRIQAWRRKQANAEGAP